MRGLRQMAGIDRPCFQEITALESRLESENGFLL